MTNPESAVLDAIDELVDECMAAGVDEYGNPLDCYNRDRYPKCDKCAHDWHGLGCVWDECPCGTVYADQVELVRLEDSRGYTLADLEDLRCWQDLQCWPQCYILGHVE